MCLGIPGKVIEIYDMEGTLMSKVDFGGVTQEVCVATTPEVRVGQYVLVHAGFALNLMSDQEAHETIKLLEDIDRFNRARESQEAE
jgi:hydrogenase expression/formation protein HypC